MNLESIVEKEAYSRPGFTLVAFKEAALPVYVLSARVITLEQKVISPIEEGCIKAIDAGLTDIDDISRFLGLSLIILNSIFAGLNSKEYINYIRPTANLKAKVHLTEKGKLILGHSKMIEPVERIVKITYDPLLKKVIFLSPASLFKPKFVKDFGWLEMPLCGLKKPESADIPLSDIDKTLERLSKVKNESRELIAVRRIERRELNFVPAIVLYYRANTGKEIQVAFHKEEGISRPHELAFEELGGPALIGSKSVLKRGEPPDFDNLINDTLINEIDTLNRSISVARETLESSNINSTEVAVLDAQSNVKLAQEKLRQMTQRPFFCHEHPKIFCDALLNTKKRLLIISPWIKNAVVDDKFIKALEKLLNNDVEVFIGFGIGEEKKTKRNPNPKTPIDLQAKLKLEDLKKRHSNFTLKNIGNTHRKLMVSDDRFAIVTSFNWLSFKGDPNEKARDEYGVLISEPRFLEKIYDDGIKLIKEGYDHPAKVTNHVQKSKSIH